MGYSLAVREILVTVCLLAAVGACKTVPAGPLAGTVVPLGYRLDFDVDPDRIEPGKSEPDRIDANRGDT